MLSRPESSHNTQSNMNEFVLDHSIFSPQFRHLQVFWNSSANLWQGLWDQFLEYSGKLNYIFVYEFIMTNVAYIVGEDEFNLFVWWTTIYTFMIYWIFGAIYTIMDLTNYPKFLR